MDIEGLIKNLEALEDILKSKTLRESESLNDLSSSLERFEAALSDLKSCDKEIFHRNPKKLKPILVRLQQSISQLQELCGDQIDLLEFVSQITPFKD